MLVIGAVVSWFRLDAVTRGTIWAEDGAIFLAGALEGNPFGIVLEPYQGYLHALPRLVSATLVIALPVDAWAIGLTAASCLVVGAVAALVFVCAREVVVWLPARVAMGALTFLVPLAPYEVLGNTANLHWYLLWLAPWLLLATPRRTWSAVLLGVAGALAALTEIQMLLFVPLLAWRARDPRRWIVGAGVLLGGALQIAASIIAPRSAGSGEPPPLLSTAEGYLLHGPMAAVAPTTQVIAQWVLLFGWWGALAVLALFAAAAVWVLVRGNAVERVAVSALVVGSVVTWSAAYGLNAEPYQFYSVVRLQDAVALIITRYGVVPALLLLGVVVLATSVARRNGVFRAGSIAILCATIALLTVATVVPHSSERSAGPAWEDGIDASRDRCAIAGPDAAQKVPLAPAGWAMRVPCSLLE